MRKLLVLFMVVLLALAVAGEEELKQLEANGYIVTGEKVEQLGEDIKISAEEETVIAWTPGQKGLCAGDCVLKISGFECVLAKEGQCQGVSRDKILLDMGGKNRTFDFGENTKLLYDLDEEGFTVLDKAFMFMGQEVSSEAPVKLVGDKVTGSKFSFGGFEVSSEEGLAEIAVSKNGIVASKNTDVNYRGIRFEGKSADYELCLSESDCVFGERSSIRVYKKTVGKAKTEGTVFMAIGKSDGGPKVTFLPGNPVLPVGTGDAKFVIEKLEDSSLAITPRGEQYRVPWVELKVSSAKKSEGEDPAVTLVNGRTVLMAFSDDLWIRGASGRVKAIIGEEGIVKSREPADSFPMVLAVEPDVLKNQKLLMNEFNGIAIVPASQAEGMTDEQLSDMPAEEISEVLAFLGDYPPKMLNELPKLSNLEAVEGFSSVDTMRLERILDTLPETLTKNLRSLQYVSDEEAARQGCDKNCAAWVDGRGGMFLKKAGIGESAVYHELVHNYLRALERRNPENARLLDEYEDIIKQFTDAEAKKGGPGYSERSLVSIQGHADEIRAERDRLFTQIPIVREWMSANEDRTMRTDPDEYCNEKVRLHEEGGHVWEDGTDEPRHGVISPYGCTDLDEDMGTYIGEVFRDPKRLIDAAVKDACPPPNVYAKKIYLLQKYGLIEGMQYEGMLGQSLRDCIGMAMEK